MKYIALTLGPITRTIDMAENTRGLWAASFLFSYMGKEIIRPFKDRSFLLPYISDEMFTGKFDGAGVFPDRYIFKSEEGDFEAVRNRVNNVLNELASKIAEITGLSPDTVVLPFLHKYLKVYFYEKDFTGNTEKEIKTSCEKSLALLEMQDAVVSKVDDKNTVLNRFFDRVTTSFLTDDAGFKEKGFPTIVKISSGESDEAPKHPYQRYIAIVKADGDSMGKAFATIDNSMKLSSALFEFNKKAATIISDYKGLPVYIGGDDLLFFAPIFTEKGSIFSLLNELDAAFHDSIKEKTNLGEHPTLSFGVSVSYYKYPMFEALSLADSLLKEAKAADAEKDEDVLKNNIVFAVQKHSGQSRSVLLHKGCVETLKLFNDIESLLIRKTSAREESGKEEKKMLSSVMHGLREEEAVLSIAIKDKDTLEYFLKNNFNEVYKQNTEFFEMAKDLLLTTYQEYQKDGRLAKLKHSLPKNMLEDADTKVTSAEKIAIETAYNALQFVHLVNQRKDEQNENI